jgi:hypothetical protein
MAMSKEQYRKLGRECAANNKVEMPSLHPGSWQHKAFFEGYDAVAKLFNNPVTTHSGRVQVVPPPEPMRKPKRGPHWREDVSGLRVVDALTMSERCHGFDKAAAEHLMVLTVEHNFEHDLKRRTRLQRAIARVMRRHERRVGVFLGLPMRRPVPLPSA